METIICYVYFQSSYYSLFLHVQYDSDCELLAKTPFEVSIVRTLDEIDRCLLWELWTKLTFCLVMVAFHPVNCLSILYITVLIWDNISPQSSHFKSVYISATWIWKQSVFYDKTVNILPGVICFVYASPFRCRRHYVFGLSICPSEAWNTLFPPVHGSVGPSDQLWLFCGMSVRLSVRLYVRPSRKVSGHLPENAWREWPVICNWHADVSWPPPELIRL